MIVVGRLVSILLDQRDLLSRINQVDAAKASAGSEAIARRRP